MNVAIDEFNDGCAATLNVSSASSDHGGNDNADKICVILFQVIVAAIMEKT